MMKCSHCKRQLEVFKAGVVSEHVNYSCIYDLDGSVGPSGAASVKLFSAQPSKDAQPGYYSQVCLR